MRTSLALGCTLLAFLAFLALPAGAGPESTEALAREIHARSVSFRTVAGGAQVPALANYLAGKLRDGGFAETDIEIHALGESAALVALLRGSGKRRPLLLNAHMDVVEARRDDWSRDPFTLTEAGGYLYGRGALDDKFEMSLMVAVLVRLRSQGYRPERDVILALSGDEETGMKTTAWLARRFPDAELMLNGDDLGGILGDDGRPRYYRIEAAEKTYASFELRARNPGGHSSQPRTDNAIYELAAALTRVAAHEFPVQSNELTRAYFRATGALEGGELGRAMGRFAEDPGDAAAAATIARSPEHAGAMRTTCVATMLAGGHAENALPQSARATLNCRVFPGTPVASVRAALERVVADPKIEVHPVGEVIESDASPLRPDVMAAVRKAVDSRHPGLPIVPYMSPGASDCVHFRAAGIPSYIVPGIFMKAADDFSHGRDERIPADAFAGALRHWEILIRELAGPH
jgi:acetylornithine deacetylase/succinyl-diaminopimelate desuccinylase-like protein